MMVNSSDPEQHLRNMLAHAEEYVANGCQEGWAHEVEAIRWALALQA